MVDQHLTVPFLELTRRIILAVMLAKVLYLIIVGDYVLSSSLTVATARF
jgi:hypothetical protein